MATNIYPTTNEFVPTEILDDPVNKLRVSQPQSLIDTDFEYGTQVTKWENVSLLNNRPYFFFKPTPLTNVTAITMAAGSKDVVVSTVTPPLVGTPVNVQDTILPFANGNYVVESVVAGTSFTYTAKSANYTAITALLDPLKTNVFPGTPYTGSRIGGAPTLSVSGTDYKVTVTTTVPHGLYPGNEIAITGITGTNPPNGNFNVVSTPTPTSFIYYANPARGIPATLVATSAFVYARPQSQFLHRPFDGGVLFSTNSASNNVSSSRQTRRYFRYQSGKGIQFSSGTLLKPYATVDRLSASGTTVTVTTKEQHNMQPGISIIVAGAVESAYNGTFTVVSTPRANAFTYTALSTPSAAVASGEPTVTVDGWHGAKNRLGMFDQQNGVFFEFDGQNLYAVRRSSTFQLSGKVSVTNGSNTVAQTNAEFPTIFAKQLKIGDWITLRGQSYEVLNIASDTSLTITPSYRGPSATYVTVSKMTDTKIPQSSFNLDKLDGTGPSGYNMDLGKMQMFYIDYSWYGAGFIRWGVRATNGDIIYAHKMQNNNVNSEAYMRSGNLPGRYESVTESPITNTTATVNPADTTITVASTEDFPTAGSLLISNASTMENVTYTGKTATTFTGVTRTLAGSAVAGVTTTWTSGAVSGTVSSATGIQVGQRVASGIAAGSQSPIPDGTFVTNVSGTTITLSDGVTAANPTMIFTPAGATTAQTFTYSATAPTSVQMLYPTFAPSISHWGTSVIMDGRFDDDKSLVFTYGQTVFSNIPASASPAATTATGTINTNSIVVALATGIVVGMAATGAGIQSGTIVTAVSGTTITLSQPLTAAMSATAVSFTGGNSKALFSIRVAPSVDNNQTAAFGARELLNRMQLKLDALGISTKTTSANMLVRAYLNGTTTLATNWTNAVGNAAGVENSSLAQIADHGTAANTVYGGEVIGGFIVSGTDRLELTSVRDLGNSLLGGGSTTSNSQFYPDGPDILTIVVTNLGATAIDVLGRISWTEAQA